LTGKKTKDRVLNLDQIMVVLSCVSSSWHRRAIYMTCIIEWRPTLAWNRENVLSLSFEALTEIAFVAASNIYQPVHLIRKRSWIISQNSIFLLHQTSQQYFWLIIHDRFSRNEQSVYRHPICHHLSNQHHAWIEASRMTTC